MGSSTSFASAHVFPGGNLSKADGDIEEHSRHVDGPVYRVAAIRECFEESGILLAKRDDGSDSLLEVSEDVRESARKDIHAGKLNFQDWVSSRGGILDLGNYTTGFGGIPTDMALLQEPLFLSRAG